MPDVLDIFSGTGWGVACREQGLSELGIDSDANVIATRHAAGMESVHADVSTLDPAKWAGVDGLIASPPCQDFSIGGLRAGIDGERGKLTFEALRYALAIRPRWMAFEQVPQVAPYFESFAMELRANGYSVAVGVLGAERFGVPTIRRRVFLVANRDVPVTLPAPTHGRFRWRAPDAVTPGLPRWRSVREVLDLPADLALWGTVRSADSPHRRAYDLRSLDWPSVCVTRFSASWWYKAADGTPHRQATIDELARVQSYPPGFPFVGARRTQMIHVANCVPPTMAGHVIRAARGC
ncbi:DNA cytosine methyltransferase [Streptomyces sp. NPDC088768]|uniref:DNA cytosine methyltransferase n=1 Tax=Streptomyces sp. NPDC088768 TaxID=3365894 RepID=UPI00380E8688